MANKETKTSGQRRKEELASLCKELKDSLSGNGCDALEKQACILDKIFLHTLCEANKSEKLDLKLCSLALRAQNNYRKTVLAFNKLCHRALSFPSLRGAQATQPVSAEVKLRLRAGRQSRKILKNAKTNYTNLYRHHDDLPSPVAYNDNEIKVLKDINRSRNARRQRIASASGFASQIYPCDPEDEHDFSCAPMFHMHRAICG